MNGCIAGATLGAPIGYLVPVPWRRRKSRCSDSDAPVPFKANADHSRSARQPDDPVHRRGDRSTARPRSDPRHGKFLPGCSVPARSPETIPECSVDAPGCCRSCASWRSDWCHRARAGGGLRLDGRGPLARKRLARQHCCAPRLHRGFGKLSATVAAWFLARVGH
jgi:hypothetical protein